MSRAKREAKAEMAKEEELAKLRAAEEAKEARKQARREANERAIRAHSARRAKMTPDERRKEDRVSRWIAITALLLIGGCATIVVVGNRGGSSGAGATRSPITTTTTQAARRPQQTMWLNRIREANTLDGEVEIQSVTTSNGVMRITTSLGHAADDSLRRGMAAEICFGAQAAGWTDHIEVLAKSGGVLAWTGASNSGCQGYG